MAYSGNYAGLRIAKGILFRVFVVGYVFLILSWILLSLTKPYWVMCVSKYWHIPNPAFWDVMIISFFGMAKFLLFFYALIPAIAICWMLRKLDKQNP